MEIPGDIPRSRRNRYFAWLKIALIIYCAIGIAVYYLQDFIILHPATLPRTHQFNFAQPFHELNIAFDKQTNINIVQFTTGSQPKGVVLYFHGNKTNIERYAGYSNLFTKNDYDVWMIDYPGYGKSTGKFTEQRVYDWSLILYNMARKRFNPDSIIIYGKSLGTGIASQLASIRDSKYLILETPYYSMPSMASTYLWMYPVNNILHYRFPTYQYLEQVTAPVIIFHGTTDRTIPYINAEKLRSGLKSGDQFITIEGGKHNDLTSYKMVQQKLDSLLR